MLHVANIEESGGSRTSQISQEFSIFCIFDHRFVLYTNARPSGSSNWHLHASVKNIRLF